MTEAVEQIGMGAINVYQCPQCSSPSVEYSALADSDAKCMACEWAGVKEDLLVTPFEHLLGSREGIGFELFNDTRRLLSDPAFLVVLGGFLSRWGFIDLKQEQKLVVARTTRYVSAIARAILTAVIEERGKIEEESVRG